MQLHTLKGCAKAIKILEMIKNKRQKFPETSRFKFRDKVNTINANEPKKDKMSYRSFKSIYKN